MRTGGPFPAQLLTPAATQNVGAVKTFQHAKAMGAARTQSRGFMFPIYGGPEEGLPTQRTDFGYDKVPQNDTMGIDSGPGVGLLCHGRLELVSTEVSVQDVRIAHKEAYRLFWLPFDPATDWTNGNPVLAPDTQTQGMRKLAPKQRIWIATESVVAHARSDRQEMRGLQGAETDDGQWLTGFDVIEAPFNAAGEIVEYEALIVRVEGARRRQVYRI